MDSQRRERIESVLNQARALEPNRRSSFLTEACAGDAALRTDVRGVPESGDLWKCDDGGEERRES